MIKGYLIDVYLVRNNYQRNDSDYTLYTKCTTNSAVAQINHMPTRFTLVSHSAVNFCSPMQLIRVGTTAWSKFQTIAIILAKTGIRIKHS